MLIQKATQIKRTASHTTTPLVVEDIKNDKLFNNLITTRYDSGMVYTTNAYGDTVPVGEFIMTTNKLPSIKEERTNDRLGVIPFGNWGKISIKQKNEKEMKVIT